MSKVEKVSRIVYDKFNRPPSVGRKCDGASKTLQSFKDDADVNVLIGRIAKGQVDVNSRGPGEFGDVSQIGDYRESLEKVQLAQEAFYGLPAKVRSRFRNDAAEFLDFIANSDNLSEMYDLGLAERPSESTEASGGDEGVSSESPDPLKASEGA